MTIGDIKIPCLKLQQKTALIDAAEMCALRHCAPVFLVGSALTSMYPRDIDIYIGLSEESYLRLFTNFGKKSESESDHYQNIQDMKIQMAKIYKKEKEYFESRVKAWDFDVKFMNLAQVLQHNGERLRLDFVFEELW